MSVLAAQVERQALLVAIDTREIGALAVLKRRTPATRAVAVGRLDLDNLGAVVAEHLGAERSCQNARKIDDLEPG